MLTAYLVDDEELALLRLARLLQERGGVKLAGSTTSAPAAVDFLRSTPVDVLFLDIQMPGLNGFELLARLPAQPAVIFTTAFNEYALRAFDVNSIGYLLKPVELARLDRALAKLEALRGDGGSTQLGDQLERLLAALAAGSAAPRAAAARIASRLGDRILLLDVDQITHFTARDKLTYASLGGKEHAVDYTIAELEEKLAASGFIRIHRSTLVNLALVDEMHRWFRGRMVVRMRDSARTELTVSRDHVKSLKDRLNLD